jgi:hypothetical protein
MMMMQKESCPFWILHFIRRSCHRGRESWECHAGSPPSHSAIRSGCWMHRTRSLPSSKRAVVPDRRRGSGWALHGYFRYSTCTVVWRDTAVHGTMATYRVLTVWNGACVTRSRSASTPVPGQIAGPWGYCAAHLTRLHPSGVGVYIPEGGRVHSSRGHSRGWPGTFQRVVVYIPEGGRVPCRWDGVQSPEEVPHSHTVSPVVLMDGHQHPASFGDDRSTSNSDRRRNASNMTEIRYEE